MTHCYVLDGRTPRAEPDIRAWVQWFETADSERQVDRTDIGDDHAGQRVTVSTVFLGIDHAFDGGPPVLFETMVFGADDGAQRRYRTWADAEAGHAAIVQQVRAALRPREG